MLEKYQPKAHEWERAAYFTIEDLNDVTCLGHTKEAQLLFVGTKDGLIQAFSSVTLKPASQPLTISPYAIRNVECFKYGSQIHLAIALSSG